MTEVVMVDSGGANLGSVRQAFERLGQRVVLTRDARRIRRAARVVLPGVGAAAPAMQRLSDADLVDVLRGLTQPVLGICLGMQLLARRSAEGDTACLGVVDAPVQPLPPSPGVRVPHMGWNTLVPTSDAHPLLRGLPSAAHVYFVHSYALPCGPWTAAYTLHGVPFTALLAQGNWCGMQFHPERSGPLGAQLLRNFLAL